MAVDDEGVPELLDWLSPTHLRFCPVHRWVGDPDPRIVKGAGRICPVGGEPLQSIFTRFRSEDGGPMPEIDPWSNEVW